MIGKNGYQTQQYTAMQMVLELSYTLVTLTNSQ